MANKVVKLAKGWQIGKTFYGDVELRPATVGDILDAGAASERAVETPQGTKLVQSPTLAGWEILSRQIVRVGDFDGVITRSLLKGLRPEDFEALQIAAAEMERDELEANEARGRGDRQPA